jgi:hypothetical protein
MTEHEAKPALAKIHEKPRIEEHYVFAILAIPVFLVTILIVFLIATVGTK